ncbi:Hpt domain-containing protein [Psychroserpens jangbogonensis]|uniref:Hpt domain-containing protein n=1 Tax=Psychroserpens jangbogonensis TaxID=1484460 RepID=UPI00053E3D71|nr:Hpt domain-containing protein [Psychroserpens jangbogonensis]
MHWNTKIINPQDLNKISRGDDKIILKYLLQFQELIPQRIDSLKESLKAEDRKQVRQLLHQMSPQIQFFGIMDLVKPIRRLELDYETMPLEELNTLIETVIIKLDLAINDVNLAIRENF